MADLFFLFWFFKQKFAIFFNNEIILCIYNFLGILTV